MKIFLSSTNFIVQHAKTQEQLKYTALKNVYGSHMVSHFSSKIATTHQALKFLIRFLA
jgi:hypothetical protein